MYHTMLRVILTFVVAMVVCTSIDVIQKLGPIEWDQNLAISALITVVFTLFLPLGR